MDKKWISQKLAFLLVIIMLLASTFMTYIEILPNLVVQPIKETVINIIPKYSINSKKNVLLWNEGTTFEQGMAAYFYAAMPQVSFKPQMQIEGMDSAAIDASASLKVIVQASNDKGQAFWSYQLTEASIEKFSLVAGISTQSDNKEYEFGGLVIDIKPIYDRVQEIGKELEFQNGIIQVLFIGDYVFKGQINGEDYNNTVTQILPLTLANAYFSVPTLEEARTSIAIKSSLQDISWSAKIIEIIKAQWLLIGIDVVLLLILVVLIISQKFGKAKTQIEYKRFKEWITEGSVDIKNRMNISIYSLEGLVDMAIDLDKRVIYDSKIHKYFVLADDLVYSYDPERSSQALINKPQLGKILLERGLILPEQLETGLYYQERLGTRLGESLMALGFIDESNLYRIIAAQQKLDYIELDAGVEWTDLEWVSQMSIKQARAIQALPLGKRTDGRMVIACGEPSREGISHALSEMFGGDILLVASKPSAIYSILERLNLQETQKMTQLGRIEELNLEPRQRLSAQERDELIEAYRRGSIHAYLFLKAAGMIDPIVLGQAPETEPLLNWLVGKNIIEGEVAGLINGLEKLIASFNWKKRQEGFDVDLIMLLQNSNYLTEATAEWIRNEMEQKGLTAQNLMIRNHLVSKKTIRRAQQVIDVFGQFIGS